MATLIDQQFLARLRALNDKFAASVPDTLARLRELRAGVDVQAPDADVLARLQETLHTIAGSAATFGFRNYGQGARALEQRLRVLAVDAASTVAQREDWLAALDRFVAQAQADPKGEFPDSEK